MVRWCFGENIGFVISFLRSTSSVLYLFYVLDLIDVHFGTECVWVYDFVHLEVSTGERVLIFTCGGEARMGMWSHYCIQPYSLNWVGWSLQKCLGSTLLCLQRLIMNTAWPHVAPRWPCLLSNGPVFFQRGLLCVPWYWFVWSNQLMCI